VLLRQFFISVMVQWTERPKGWGGKAKKYDKTKPTLQCHAILSFSCVEFILATLSAHGYEKIYEPGKKKWACIQWSGSL
jgi:hypothetical protein